MRTAKPWLALGAALIAIIIAKIGVNAIGVAGLIIASYFIGAVPFGILLAQLFGLGDLRNIGSGNIGTTNVLRTGNKSAAALTLVLDMAKGSIAALLGGLVSPIWAALAMFAAIIGHCYPIWLGFRGGKGVATYLGGLLGMAWPLGFLALGLWLAVALVSRISSLSALVSIFVTPLVALAFGYGDAFVMMLAASGAVIIWKHRDNINRLRHGEEAKISFGKKG